MFDWEGEELANIIWGEAGENEDHIVPYPDENYEKSPGPYGEHSKVSDREAADVKLAEKTPDWSNTRYDTHGMVSSSRDESCSAPVLSSSNVTKLDLQHTDEKALVDNGSQSFDTQPEDRDASNLLDYGWPNVGSFDDLDGILSNNEYENADILSIDSPSLRLGDLRSDCEHVKTKSGFIKDVNTNLEKMECSEGKNEKSASSNIARRTPPLVYPVGAVNLARPCETGIRIGKMGMEGQKCDPWFSLGNQGKEIERRYAQHLKISSSEARNYETESSPYKQFISPLLSPCDYNIIGNKQSSGSSSLMSLSMTPQEKIEKLRRRQQMRALLAIRKQQQEYRHNDCSNESQNDESLSTLASLEKSDLDTGRMMMTRSSLEDTILHQLENVISTLGIEIRICIRDSLFRLAQSSLQRQYAGDTVSTNEPNVVTKERLGSTQSSARTPVGETKTNPIDRVVAHLLFHRPSGLSGELLQLLEPPSSGSRVGTEGSS